MAITKYGNYWYDDDDDRWYHHEPVKRGDEVVCTTNNSYTYGRGAVDRVLDAEYGSYEYKYVQLPEWGYEQSKPVYWQNVTLKESPSRSRSMKNWKKYMSKTTPALESNDPCLVQEFEETVVDGKTVVKNIGYPIPMDNMSAARIYTTNEITNSIRDKNVYRQFYIFQRRHIARAKKPEIEFA